MPDNRYPAEFDDLLTITAEMYRMFSCGYLLPDDPMPISPNQKRAITFLKRNPGSTLKDVAAELDVNLGSASDLVDRLVQADFIERRTNPQDRRQVQLSLTESAMAKVKRMRAQRMSEFAHVREELSDEEWNGFMRGMRIWVDHMSGIYPRKHAVGTGD
jgi:DNA-binding MarR family transcriptional regulator